MRVAELATRALLGGMALDHLEIDVKTSPNPGNLLIRQSCRSGETYCGDGCMPLSGVCCAALGRDSYCDPGYYCMPTRGCCREGRTCSGVGSCDPGDVPCNTGCMPASGVCCPGGGYCDAGYVCTSDNKCRLAGSGSGGGGSSGGGSSGGGSSSGCDIGKVTCDSNYCIPSGGVCCLTGLGKYCDPGYYCVSGGCCRNGRTCTGSPGGSDDDDDDDDITTTTRVRTTSTSTTTTTSPTSTPTRGFTSDESDGDDSGLVGGGGGDDAGSTTTSTGPPGFTPGFTSGDGPTVTDAAAGLKVPAALVVGVVGLVALLA